MGDRANITMTLDKRLDEMTEEEKDNCPSIYVHWHGNPDTVQMFLDETNSFARLCQVIGNHIDGNLSFGVGTRRSVSCADWDNGTYWIDNHLNIVGRENSSLEEYKANTQ